MKITAWKCDRCGKEYREKGGKTFHFAVGTERDQIEGRTYDVSEEVDMCFPCVSDLAEQFIRALDYAARKNLLTEIKSRCP
jgi:hypothetical protein